MWNRIFGRGNKLRLDYMLDKHAAESLAPALEAAGLLVDVDPFPYCRIRIARPESPNVQLQFWIDIGNPSEEPQMYSTQFFRSPPTDEADAALLELAVALDDALSRVGAHYLDPGCDVGFQSKCPTMTL